MPRLLCVCTHVVLRRKGDKTTESFTHCFYKLFVQDSGEDIELLQPIIIITCAPCNITMQTGLFSFNSYQLSATLFMTFPRGICHWYGMAESGISIAQQRRILVGVSFILHQNHPSHPPSCVNVPLFPSLLMSWANWYKNMQDTHLNTGFFLCSSHHCCYYLT